MNKTARTRIYIEQIYSHVSKSHKECQSGLAVRIRFSCSLAVGFFTFKILELSVSRMVTNYFLDTSVVQKFRHKTEKSECVLIHFCHKCLHVPVLVK